RVVGGIVAPAPTRRADLSGTIFASPRAPAARPGPLRTKETADWLLFRERILLGIRGPVQSLHRPGPRPSGLADRSGPFYPELARHRGGTRLLDHLPERGRLRRPADRGRAAMRLSHRAAASQDAAV